MGDLWRSMKPKEELDRKTVMEIVRPLDLDLGINQLGKCEVLSSKRSNEHVEIGGKCEVLSPKRGWFFFNLQASYNLIPDKLLPEKSMLKAIEEKDEKTVNELEEKAARGEQIRII